MRLIIQTQRVLMTITGAMLYSQSQDHSIVLTAGAMQVQTNVNTCFGSLMKPESLLQLVITGSSF